MEGFTPAPTAAAEQYEQTHDKQVRNWHQRVVSQLPESSHPVFR